MTETTTDPIAEIDRLAELSETFSRTVMWVEEDLVRTGELKPLTRNMPEALWNRYWQTVLDSAISMVGVPCREGCGGVVTIDQAGRCNECAGIE